MCDPVTAGLILTAAGTGTQAVNNNQAMRRQDRQAAQGIRRQGEIQRESNQMVNQNIEDIGRNTGEAERTQSLEGFLNTLRTADDKSTGGLDAVPGASDRFAERVGAGREAVRSGATDRAGRLSRIDAPGFQRRNENAGVARTASNLGEQQRRSSAEDFLTQLRVAEERPNEFINALGSIMSGAGSAISMGGGGGLANLFKGGPNLGKLAKAGTLVDAPVGNPFVSAVRGFA